MSKNRISIPFDPIFRKAMRSGVKCITARTRRYGKPGQEFKAFGRVFVITAVELYPLVVSTENYDLEGCKNAEEFTDIWERLHPRAGYDASRPVYIHSFRSRKKVEDYRKAVKASGWLTICPPPISQGAYLPLNTPLTVGFGAVTLTCDGQHVWSSTRYSEKRTLRWAERQVNGKDGVWEIEFFGPLRGEIYRRHGKNQWRLERTNPGFA